MRRLAQLAFGFLLAGGFYMLLIDNPSPPELYGMVGVALLAAIAYEVSRRERLGEASIEVGWLARAWRPLASIPRHVIIVSWAALAQLFSPQARRGAFRAIDFQGGETERDQGRNAVAQAFGSLAPNTIVIGVDDEQQLLLVHQLQRRGGREEMDVLGLG